MMAEILVASGFSAAIGALYAVVHLLYQHERATRPGDCSSEADVCGRCGCCSMHRPNGSNSPSSTPTFDGKGNTHE